MKVALTGPSGSGKTLSALLMAHGMGQKIAVIDTENGSAALYAGQEHEGIILTFDHAKIDPPYTVEKYIEAIRQAWEAKYDVLIVDSLSHAWAGEGGLIQQKEELDARGGKGEKNKFANWAGITKQHEKFKAWLLKADMHMIVTMRSKQDYVLGEGNAPIKVGMAPVQREGMEYEFALVLDMAMNHSAKAGKDRTSLFDSKLFVPTVGTGKALMDWMGGASGELIQRPVTTTQTVAERHTPPPKPDPLAKLRARVFAEGAKYGYGDVDIKALCVELFPKVVSRADLSQSQMEMLLMIMKDRPPKKVPAPVTTAGHKLGSPEDIAAAGAETASTPEPSDADDSMFPPLTEGNVEEPAANRLPA